MTLDRTTEPRGATAGDRPGVTAGVVALLAAAMIGSGLVGSALLGLPAAASSGRSAPVAPTRSAGVSIAVEIAPPSASPSVGPTGEPTDDPTPPEQTTTPPPDTEPAAGGGGGGGALARTGDPVVRIAVAGLVLVAIGVVLRRQRRAGM